MDKNHMNRLINMLVLIIMIALVAYVIRDYRNGLFSSEATFRNYIQSFGIWAAVVFILIQIIQVVIPVLPSSLGCVVGIVVFGPWIGFLYNYIAICTGSIIAFLLSKRYGSPLVKRIIGKKHYDRYISWVDKGTKFDNMFAVAIFVPGAPDDFLCYIAGMSKMKLKKFIIIILLGKPLSIAIFSLGTAAVLHLLLSFF